MSKDHAPHASTLQRALMVLRVFSERDVELSASDIARMTGLPQPTVWRFCQTFLAQGFLRSDAAGTTFRPGLQILQLGFAAINQISLGELAQEVLVEVARRFHAVAGVAVLDGDSVRYVQRVQPPEAVLSYNISVGSTLPVALASAGWTFLATMPETEREQMIARLKQRDPENWAVAEPKFRKAMAAFPARQYMAVIDLLHPGLTSLAVFVPVANKAEPYAVYCTGLTSRMIDVLDSEIAPELAAAADKLARIRQVEAVKNGLTTSGT
jgi:DNA-binding IclR family transcriptional regulator